MKKLFFTTALVSQFVQINLLFAAEQDVSNWDDFKSAIINSSVNSVIVDSPLDANSGLVFNVNRNLTLTGKETTQNISGNSNQMHLLSRYQTGVLTIDNLSFDKFTRYSQAGTFDSTKGGTIIFNNSTVSNFYSAENSSMDIYGGVFNINDGAYGELNNSTFQNNIFYTTVSDTDWAVATGGAIHVQGNIIAGGTTYDASHIKINNSKLIGNGIIASAADAWGGALYLEGVADTISNASFNQNLAKSTADGKNAHGGAIAVGGANTGRGTATIENLENTSFIGNQAISDKGESFGGALFVAADGVIKNIIGGTFTGNIAQNGGAIYNLGQINQIKNTDFTTESDTIINETNAKIGTITNINMQAEFVNLGTVSAINSADSGSSYIKTMLNNGTIADISGSTTFGSLINSGLISGNNNSFIVEDGLGNTNTGTINANNITIKGGNSVNNGIITGTLKFLSENSGATFTNTNQIEYIADSAFGADASGVSLTNTGTIKNISNAAMEGILQNSGSISVSAADGGANVLSAADIINAGELSFNNADYTGMLHNYKNFTLSGNNKLTGNITNQINAVLNLSDAAEIIGNFENNGITNVTGTLTATDTVNNGNLNFNNVVYNGNLHNNTLLSISGATETTGGIISNESQITVNNGAELNIAGGINNSGLILNNGTLLIAGNSQNSGFISGNVTIGNGQAADFDNSGFIKTKKLAAIRLRKVRFGLKA